MSCWSLWRSISKCARGPCITGAYLALTISKPTQAGRAASRLRHNKTHELTRILDCTHCNKKSFYEKKCLRTLKYLSSDMTQAVTVKMPTTDWQPWWMFFYGMLPTLQGSPITQKKQLLWTALPGSQRWAKARFGKTKAALWFTQQVEKHERPV